MRVSWTARRSSSWEEGSVKVNMRPLAGVSSRNKILRLILSDPALLASKSGQIFSPRSKHQVGVSILTARFMACRCRSMVPASLGFHAMVVDVSVMVPATFLKSTS